MRIGLPFDMKDYFPLQNDQLRISGSNMFRKNRPSFSKLMFNIPKPQFSQYLFNLKLIVFPDFYLIANDRT